MAYTEPMLASPLLIQSLHAELLRRCDEEPGTDGGLVAKLIKGRRYWYLQDRDEDGRRCQRYLGPETPELVDRVARQKQARAAAKERRTLAALMVRTFAAPHPPPAAGRVIAALAGAGVFRQAVLVGPAAYQTYLALLGSALPDSDLQAGDPIQVGAAGELSLLAALQGTAKAYRVVSRTEGGVRTTSHVAVDGPRVDLLTPAAKPESDEPLLLEFLLEKPERAVVLHDGGIAVPVPAPSRFAVAGLIAGRPAESPRVQALVDALLKRRPDAFGEVWHDAHRRGPAWRHRLFAAIDQLPLPTRTALPQA
ncbi:MAG: hypothetical protein KGJ78_06495 [Alphaproteobacteria bacterium]|nr:hypothetical protein [Alphaproteobacteria bacterium]